MKQPVLFAVGTNEGRSKATNTERLINLFAEQQPPSAKAQAVLYGTPGLSRFCEIDQGPVFGLHVMNEQLFIVTKKSLYRMTGTYQLERLGDCAPTGRVSIADNGFDLVFVDGYQGWKWTDGGSVEKIVGDGWYPANTVTFQDGYFIFNRAGTGQFFTSKLLSTEFDPLAFATAEGAPDDTVAVISNYRELWVFGKKSVEIWYNSGNVDFAFDRMQGAFIERGTLAPQSIIKVNGQMVWLGDDGIVYAAVGYQPQRISTHAVEYSIDQAVRKDDAFAWWYSEEGHVFYMITFPTAKLTWSFDFATGMWHERQHITHGRHVANCCINWKERNLVGDFSAPFVYELAMDAKTDHGLAIRRVAQSAITHAGRERITAYSFELDMESGLGLPTGQGDDPQAMLQWSDDGGNTWSNEHWAPIGKIGQYLTRVKWNRLGRFRQRTWRVVITDPVPVAIIAAWMEV